MALRMTVLLSLLALVGCGGPFLVFPGGKLSGESRPAPDDWSFAGDYGMTELETRPADPYSVNIAYTVVDGVLYINAGDTETQWVKNMDADPRIRMRIDGVLYDLVVERVNDEAEIATFGKAWTDQSFFRRDPTELDQVWLYRAKAR